MSAQTTTTVSVIVDRPCTAASVLRGCYPIEFGDPKACYLLRGTSPAGEEITGELGPVEAPNAFGLPPFRPLLIRGASCTGTNTRLDLQVDEDEAGVLAGGLQADGQLAQAGFYFGTARWDALKWTTRRAMRTETIVRAEGILPFSTGEGNAPAYGICDLYITQGTSIVRWVLRVQGTMGGAGNSIEAAKGLHTPASFEMPMLSVKAPEGVSLFALHSIERGGGERLILEDGTQAIVLQAPQMVGPATPMIFEGFFSVGGHVSEAELSGPVYVCPVREVMDQAMPPFGSVGPQLLHDRDLNERLAFELMQARRNVARGLETRSVFLSPMPDLLTNGVYPGMTGTQGDFGLHSASVVYGGIQERPRNLTALLAAVRWDAARNSHWRYVDGTCVDYSRHPRGWFRNQEPHRNEGVSPDRFGLRPGDVCHHAGGMIGRDLQHHSINALVTSYLLTAEPWLRDCIEDEVAAYLVERFADERTDAWGYIEAVPEIDSIRSFRSEYSMCLAFACTGDMRIPRRFFERIRVYDELDYPLRQALKNGDIEDGQFVPMLIAARVDLPATVMIDPPDDRVLPGAWYSSEWQYTVGAPGMILMARVIRAQPLSAEELTHLGLFERAVSACLSRFIRDSIIEGDVNRIVKGVEWPVQPTSISAEARYMDGIAKSDQPNHGPWTYCESNWADHWCTALLEMVAGQYCGAVLFDGATRLFATKILKDSMRKWWATKPRPDNERMRWIIGTGKE